MFKLKLKKESNEVFYLICKSLSIKKKELNKLHSLACKSSKKRARFCLHESKSSLIHKMIIFHTKNTDIPVHMHIHSEELIFILQGRLKLFHFNTKGKKTREIKMAASNMNMPFLSIIPKGTYHSMKILSKYAIFLEIIKGPFKTSNLVMANQI